MGGGQDLGIVDGPAAELLGILEMEERQARAEIVDGLHRGVSSEMRPIEVDLRLQVARFRGTENPFEDRPPLEEGVFSAVIVVGQLETEGAKRLAVLIQQLADLLAGGYGDKPFGRQPRQNDKGTLQEQGFVDDFRQARLQVSETNVHTADLEPEIGKHFSGLGDAEVTVAGGLDGRVADGGNRRQRARKIGLHVIAERPELEGYRCFRLGGHEGAGGDGLVVEDHCQSKAAVTSPGFAARSAA